MLSLVGARLESDELLPDEEAEAESEEETLTDRGDFSFFCAGCSGFGFLLDSICTRYRLVDGISYFCSFERFWPATYLKLSSWMLLSEKLNCLLDLWLSFLVFG